MTYLKSITKILISIAGCVTLAAPCALQARDISLPKYSKDAQLASFHSAVSLETNGNNEADDLFTDILSINEMDVWKRIRTGFKIPDLENPLVNSHMNYYSRRPEYFQRTTQRASKYLFHIVQECDKRGMPTELALLPFIESAYNPNARSIAKAEGLWQFIPSTGKYYDLAQNSFRDERRDIIASTDAALTYLQRLYDMFGDWHLALASYNWGEGAVMRAVKKAEAAGKSTDFNSISAYMPAETRNYVPKLQAVKNLIANPSEYRISLPAIDNQPYFVTIANTHDIDIHVAARLADISMSEFRSLNPQFKTEIIAGGDRVRILLPKYNAQRFRYNLARWKAPLSSWTAYQVTGQRERLEDIAEKYNTTADTIRHANNIPPKTVLKFGSVVLVPKPANMTADISPDLIENAYITWEKDWPVINKPESQLAKAGDLKEQNDFMDVINAKKSSNRKQQVYEKLPQQEQRKSQLASNNRKQNFQHKLAKNDKSLDYDTNRSRNKNIKLVSESTKTKDKKGRYPTAQAATYQTSSYSRNSRVKVMFDNNSNKEVSRKRLVRADRDHNEKADASKKISKNQKNSKVNNKSVAKNNETSSTSKALDKKKNKTEKQVNKNVKKSKKS